MVSPLLRGHLSYEATFPLSQRCPVNTGLTVYVLRYPPPPRYNSNIVQSHVKHHKLTNSILPVPTIFQLDFESVPTTWYFLVFHLIFNLALAHVI